MHHSLKGDLKLPVGALPGDGGEHLILKLDSEWEGWVKIANQDCAWGGDVLAVWDRTASDRVCKDLQGGTAFV